MKGVIRWDKFGNKHYFVDGQEVSEQEFDRLLPTAAAPCGGPAGAGLVGWTRALMSDSIAVHPRQIKEATDDAASKGVHTDFDSEGRPEFRDRDHRRRYCKAYGFFDRDGGYSDAQEGSTRGRDKAPDVPDFSHLGEASGPPGVEKRSSVRYFT